MSAFISNAVVVLAILVAAGYSVWRLGPRSMRDKVRARLSKMLPGVFGNLDTSTTGSCDACGGCAPASTQAPAPRKEHAVFWRRS
jgi:hypothetical protein